MNTLINLVLILIYSNQHSATMFFKSRYSEPEEHPRSLADGLWRRASAAGASTRLEKRAFGIADDM